MFRFYFGNPRQAAEGGAVVERDATDTLLLGDARTSARDHRAVDAVLTPDTEKAQAVRQRLDADTLLLDDAPFLVRLRERLATDGLLIPDVRAALLERVVRSGLSLDDRHLRLRELLLRDGALLRDTVTADLGVVLAQSAFRWRDDDDDEVNAAWLRDEDEHLTRAHDLNTRLRVQVNASGDPDPSQVQVEFSEVDAEDWQAVA